LTAEADEEALSAAWLRVRELVTSSAPPPTEEVRALELALRSVAGSTDIQQGVVPLLDRAELYGLAMAWDSDPNPSAPGWHFARFERWLKLGAPEFAFLTLAQMHTLGQDLTEAKQRAHAALASERSAREALYQLNLKALADVDPDLAQRLDHYPRLCVGLRPLGAGVAEFSSHGGSHLQLWAATPADAEREGQELLQRCLVHGECFIAGVGDGTLPALAMQVQCPSPDGSFGPMLAHVIEPNLARIRALFEIVDVTAPLREGRIWMHAGARGIDTLAHVFARGRPRADESVMGGDPVAMQMMEAAAARAATG
jgi:hypothetical protein